MSARIIQCDYDALSQVATLFGEESEAVHRLFEQVQGVATAVEQGGWVGEGARRFLSELKEIVFPAGKRLSQALWEGKEAIMCIANTLQQHEDEAGLLFQGEMALYESQRNPFHTVNARPFKPNDDDDQSKPHAQGGTSPYWNIWNTLPDWLKPWTTNPWQIAARTGHWEKLYHGAFVNGRDTVTSLLLFHYLQAAGTTHFVDSNDILGNSEFMDGVTINRTYHPGVTAKFNAESIVLLANILAQQVTGQSISGFPLTINDPLIWSIQSRFGGDMTSALGTSTVNSGGNATIQFTLIPDPANPNQGSLQITVDQSMELYDRYDWRGDPIAYNSATDTVAVVYDSNTPVLILDKSGKIVSTLPAGTDIRAIAGYTYVEFPPDSPDRGALYNLYAQSRGVTLPPEASTQVFGTFDHPHDIYAGDFHALEANGVASAFDVYSQWTFH
ncbi:MAG TPA: WXG100 family type VII secretion target, partial [Aggregatilineales bacterium]|nr:WXG100 family type VII secretion target [Aggregatilineales bacterium]